MKPNIVLFGFMGTGKSVTGRLVAEALNRSFIDMDTVIEERAGKKISAIFAEEGEAHFRSLERALVQELSAQDNLVIATGGGVVLNPDNVADFQRTGLVVCLHADPEIILKRVAKDAHRPLLEQPDKAEAVRTLLANRQALYQSLPNGIDTNTHTAQDTADAVLALYREQLSQR